MDIIMNLIAGYAALPVLAAGGLGGPVLVAAGGLVVVLAILLVFVMVLRSNGDARKTSSGIGYDAHQGPYGQSRAPVSQPNRGQRPAPPWADEYNGQRGPSSRPPSGSDWGYGPSSAPGAGANANSGYGGQNWGAPSGGSGGGSGAGWGDQPAAPQWGGNMGQMGQMDGPNQAPQWGGQPAAQGAAARNDWGQQPEPQGWNAPPTTPRGWDQPAGQAGQAGGQNWGAPAGPAAPAPAYGQQDYATNDFNNQNYATNNFNNGGAYSDEQRTHVVRPMNNQGEPKLVVSEGKEPGRAYDLRKDRITIGRSRDSDIFLEDLAVSRTHTTINRQPDGRYLLRDENSANGTMVNGQRVSDHMLEDGDKIQVGQTLLVFVYR